MKYTRALASKIRRHVLSMTHRARSAHVGTSLSSADILSVLYGAVLRINPRQPAWPDRDRFILSKGHGCAALYATLAEVGFFPLTWLEDFYLDGSRLAGHVTHTGVPGVEISTGSLGHGLPIAGGIAIAAKRDEKRHRVFTLVSDGECNEGSVWEAALFAGHHNLDNLVVIVDYNKIQSLGRVKEVLALDPFSAKWEAFGWKVAEFDGHDHQALHEVLRNLPLTTGQPSCLIAHTVKGKGVSFMEDKLLWHYRSPDQDELNKALFELGQTQ